MGWAWLFLLSGNRVRGQWLGEEADVSQQRYQAAADRLQDRKLDEAQQPNDKREGAVHEAAGALLAGRGIVDEIEQDGHVQGPESGGKKGANVARKSLLPDGQLENGNALVAHFAGALAEWGKRVSGLAGVAKQRTEELLIA